MNAKHLFRSLVRSFGRDPGLDLMLEGRTVHFRSPDEFAVALRPRTEVTAAMARHCTRTSAHRLQQELEQTRRLHRRLTELLIWGFETGEPVRDAWREAEAVGFVDEHQWRGILRAVADDDDIDERYRRVALGRFLKYVESRRIALQAAVQQDALDEETRADRDEIRRAARALAESGGDREDLTFTSMRRSPVFRRLPPHRAVEIVLGTGEAVPVFLAHRRLRLLATATGWELRDDASLCIALHEGKMIVGRSEDCDIVLHDAPPDVSRHHLAIDCREDGLRLIDLSTQGTYLPRRALAETPH
jgi:hypothetical protein